MMKWEEVMSNREDATHIREKLAGQYLFEDPTHKLQQCLTEIKQMSKEEQILTLQDARRLCRTANSTASGSWEPLNKSDSLVNLLSNDQWFDTYFIDQYNMLVMDSIKFNESQLPFSVFDTSYFVYYCALDDDASGLQFTQELYRYLSTKDGQHIMAKDMLLFPVGNRSRSHFFLVVIFPQSRRVLTIDSLGSEFNATKHAVIIWMTLVLYVESRAMEVPVDSEYPNGLVVDGHNIALDCSYEKFHHALQANNWTFGYYGKDDLARDMHIVQPNTWDCAACTVLNLEALVRGYKLNWLVKRDWDNSIGNMRTHLFTSLLTGIPIMGNRTVYDAAHHTNIVCRFQQRMMESVPSSFLDIRRRTSLDVQHAETSLEVQYAESIKALLPPRVPGSSHKCERFRDGLPKHIFTTPPSPEELVQMDKAVTAAHCAVTEFFRRHTQDVLQPADEETTNENNGDNWDDDPYYGKKSTTTTKTGT